MSADTTPTFNKVGLIGTGAMGQGIAQLSAQAGAQVLLLDTREGAAQQAVDKIKGVWATLQAKGKLTEAQSASYGARLHAVATSADLATCDLVVEAIQAQERD